MYRLARRRAETRRRKMFPGRLPICGHRKTVLVKNDVDILILINILIFVVLWKSSLSCS